MQREAVTQTDKTKRRERLMLVLSLIFLLCAILFSSGRSWLLRATAPAPRPHAVLRFALPGVDIGADAWPAGPNAVGYVELWVWSHDGDDIQTVLRVEGSPAQPRTPPRRHRLPGILAEIRAAGSALLIAKRD